MSDADASAWAEAVLTWAVEHEALMRALMRGEAFIVIKGPPDA